MRVSHKIYCNLNRPAKMCSINRASSFHLHSPSTSVATILSQCIKILTIYVIMWLCMWWNFRICGIRCKTDRWRLQKRALLQCSVVWRNRYCVRRMLLAICWKFGRILACKEPQTQPQIILLGMPLAATHFSQIENAWSPSGGKGFGAVYRYPWDTGCNIAPFSFILTLLAKFPCTHCVSSSSRLIHCVFGWQTYEYKQTIDIVHLSL